jgi:hypothetical protein
MADRPKKRKVLLTPQLTRAQLTFGTRRARPILLAPLASARGSCLRPHATLRAKPPWGDFSQDTSTGLLANSTHHVFRLCEILVQFN